ncbi:hypothetical protein FT643_01750 [Ketobacter sp. MCCC 1A13808]|uniref:alginate export family protein n=1 Tax=Ketobacter sp. MCCC 1A13808 TaxID=2602738 RepID=UPI0012EBC5BB|nr:alginate export family protein [Ketobacter sp. MCCC 1A13808]MVF10854.1 hypothetical protein [Ketobacter sp. MCCC 1A13808]
MANRKVSRRTVPISLAGVVVSTMGVVVPQSLMAADSLQDALKASTTKLSLRPRYEKVEQEGAGISEAATILSRLTFTTGNFYDVSAVLEFDDVTSMKSVDYDDGSFAGPGPAIIDPEGTEVNQAYLSYSGLDSTDFRWGRQRIVLDNQRFVGGVAWRQNEQTYDALSVTNTSFGGLSMFYAHVTDVNRIFGEGNDDSYPAARRGDHREDTNLLNLNYKFEGIGALSAYYYDIENESAAALSSVTYGVRFAGDTKFDSFSLGYELEYADQEDSANNPNSYSADYSLIGVSGTISNFTLGFAMETLGADADAGVGFTTSLATLHMFQGWADQFLVTPGAGVEDSYVTFKAGLPWGMNFVAVFHSFESAEDIAVGSSDYGTEIDAALTKKFENGATLQLKYADFSGEDDGLTPNDVEKVWITATYAI